jgi:hypothetical protein
MAGAELEGDRRDLIHLTTSMGTGRIGVNKHLFSR